jgi:integrase
VSRRNYGSGSKREVRPGVWQLRVGGRSKTVRGTSKQAERALATFVAAHGSQDHDGSETLEQLIDAWLPVAAIEPSTRLTYDSALKHLPARMRSAKVTALRLRQFDQMYANLAAAGVGANTVAKLHTALSSALTEAVRWRWIDHNPARGARRPKIPTRQINAPDPALLHRLLDRAVAEDLQLAVWLLFDLSSACRRGEQLALRWSKVDLERATVRIEASLRKDRTVKATKTNRERTIALDAATVVELRRWRTAQKERALAAGVKLVADPYVLSNVADSGTPWRPDGATQRFRRLCARTGVPGVRLNDLRHAHATMSLRAGVDPKTVADRLGNDPATMIRNYAHVMDGADRAAADTWAAAFNGA